MTFPSYSVVTEKQNISSSIALQTCSSGVMSSTCALASCISCAMLLVERRPCLVLVMWPFAVVVEGGRCFVINSLVMPGNVMSLLRCLVRTRKMADAGADPRDWWWYFAISSLLLVLSVVTMLFALAVVDGVGLLLLLPWLGGDVWPSFAGCKMVL